jgi:septum formation protein
MSAQKARVVAQGLDKGLILAGDTVAALGDEIFGKPIDRGHAERTLRVISGTAHEVITALTLLDAATDREMTWHDTTTVVMRDLTGAELSDYLDTGAWKDKAGAYGIQDHGDAFVERIEGSFTNVVGLPAEMLTRMLEEWEKTGN